MSKHSLSPNRRALYYIGMALAAIGLLLFLSVFVSGILHFGDFSHFTGRARSEMLRAFSGMVLFMVGNLMMVIGKAGLAGAGLKLDPKGARRDLEPWSRMTGGMLKDTLDEAGVNLSGRRADSALPFDEALRRLEALRQEGLLSEPEYIEARRAILDKIKGGGV